ncbi:MAG: YeeE/YedE family protein [Roseovarius sp.]|uniref:YeeE/YedE family protein n=1 Tax=Roseovarius sp. TaxID=1486281 RepID=UPI0032EC481E
MFDGISDAALMALVGLFGGGLLGLAARLGRFCTLGAIEDVLYQQSALRLRMWVLAIGVAATGVHLLAGLGAIDLSETLYLASPWSPVASILGGLIFGYGMSIAGTCGFGALARTGGGDFRAFVIVLVMGISAYIMLSGPLAAARVALISGTEVSLDTLSIAGVIGQIAGGGAIGPGLVAGLAITVAALASKDALSRPAPLVWGALVGLAIVSGWWGTSAVVQSHLSALPVVSHTYSAPLGETLLYVMTSSGGGLSFGVGSVAGVLAGAFAGSLIKGHFRWEACEDPRELRRQVLGAVLMGFGSVLAFGCTIGQGLSAFSVLAFSAPVTFAAIFIGAAIGLRQLITGFAVS